MLDEIWRKSVVGQIVHREEEHVGRRLRDRRQTLERASRKRDRHFERNEREQQVSNFRQLVLLVRPALRFHDALSLRDNNALVYYYILQTESKTTEAAPFPVTKMPLFARESSASRSSRVVPQRVRGMTNEIVSTTDDERALWIEANDPTRSSLMTVNALDRQ